MNENAINNLREALQYSPDNIPLRHHLAETLQQANRLDEAEIEYVKLLKMTHDNKYKTGLARVFYLKGEYSKCNVLLEDMIASGAGEFETIILHARALMKENLIARAVDQYQKALNIKPDFQDEELDRELRRSKNSGEMPDGTDSSDAILQMPLINFDDVGGMTNIKKEIDLKIIKPMLYPDIYKAYGKKTGGGILLYGPPGCGKTHIAKATAGQVKASFINVRLDNILDMWIGKSEKNLHYLFEIARQNKPCVLFIDEIDALGASRSDMKQSAGRHLINQFLQELDGLGNNNDGILVLGATNAPWHLDPAFRRPGRFDRIIFVPPPDEIAREAIIGIKLKNKPVNNIDSKHLAKKLDHYSGADIEAIIDIAIEEKLENSFLDGMPKPITTRDLLNAAKNHRASTQEWFSTARNYALYSNESGLYNDILTYLQINVQK
ncbi:MAG: AAA family ATPase [Bacteroidetes bacterium]|nr:AAA family ATPase [Bacteroidota bacterium]